MKLYKTSRYSLQGFTLIEILIVLTLLGLLAIAVLIRVNTQIAKGYDAVRKSNLQGIHNALIVYYLDHGAFPPLPAISTATEFSSDSGINWIPGLLDQYLRTQPKDPRQANLNEKMTAILILERPQNIISLAKATETGSIGFLKFYGGDQQETRNKIKPTSDGGFITINETNSYGIHKSRFLITKFTAAGKVIWSKTLDYATGYLTVPGIAQTTDGGYVVVGGLSSSLICSYGIFIAKLDNLGNLIWSKTTGNYSCTGDRASTVIATNDGGFVIGGQTTAYNVARGAALLSKFDSFGNQVWVKTADSPVQESINSLAQTSDGGIIAGIHAISSLSASTGTVNDFAVMKFDDSGNIVWAKLLPQQGAQIEPSVISLSDGFIIGGLYNNGSGYDKQIVKFDLSGNLLWSKIVKINESGLFGAGGLSEVLSSASDGVILAGANGVNPAIVKLNNQGDLIWGKAISLTGEIRSVIVTPNGHILAAGNHTLNNNTGLLDSYDAFVLNTDANGNLDNCSDMINITLSVSSDTTPVQDLSLAVVARTFTTNAVSLTINTIQQTVTDKCEVIMPEVSPSPVSGSSPEPSLPGGVQPPGISTTCGNKKHVYCYVVPPDRTNFILWAQLENSSDQDTILHSTSACSNITPPSPDYNYCIRSN